MVICFSHHGNYPYFSRSFKEVRVLPINNIQEAPQLAFLKEAETAAADIFLWKHNTAFSLP